MVVRKDQESYHLCLTIWTHWNYWQLKRSVNRCESRVGKPKRGRKKIAPLFDASESKQVKRKREKGEDLFVVKVCKKRKQKKKEAEEQGRDFDLLKFMENHNNKIFQFNKSNKGCKDQEKCQGETKSNLTIEDVMKELVSKRRDPNDMCNSIKNMIEKDAAML